MSKLERGFTLVELIAVVVVIGVLSIAGMPRFINLGSDARRSAVLSLKGSLQSTANLVRAKCEVSPTCDASSATNKPTMNGVFYWLNWGWPDAGDALNNGQIDTLISYSSESIGVKISGSNITEFYLLNAPNPDNCAAYYKDGFTAPNKTPTITAITSGC